MFFKVIENKSIFVMDFRFCSCKCSKGCLKFWVLVLIKWMILCYFVGVLFFLLWMNLYFIGLKLGMNDVILGCFVRRGAWKRSWVLDLYLCFFFLVIRFCYLFRYLSFLVFVMLFGKWLIIVLLGLNEGRCVRYLI